MPNYVIVATAPWLAPDGSTQPVGTVINRILAPVGFNPGVGLALAADTGQTVYTPAPPAPTLAQQAFALLAGGLTITSPTIPLAAVTFPTDDESIAKYNSVQTYILTHAGMIPGGAASGPILDSAGAWHIVTSAQYTNIVTAIATFVSGCSLVVSSYPGATLPPSVATIA